MALDVISMMESDMEKAKKASGGNGSPTFFLLKAGEKALVRPLLDLNKAVLVHKHDLWNQATKKFEVNALCAKDQDLDCKHCFDAEMQKNKKLAAVRYFIIPLWVYQIKNKDGQVVTWKDQDGNEQAIRGVRYLQMKATSPILANLLDFFREEKSILNNDFVISRTGESLDTVYTVIAKAPKPFAVPDVPAQSEDEITFRIGDLCPPALIGESSSQSAPSPSTGKVNNEPDF